MSNGKSKLDTGLVRELAAILREADLGEIEIEHEGLRIRVTKPALSTVQTYAPAPVATVAAPPLSAAMNTETAISRSEPVAAAAGAVKSPMVGTAYLAAEPGAEPFVKVGDKVAKGATLLLVEAMKTFNPVDSPRAGTITAILIEDGQPVEFGEALIVVE